MACAQCNTTPAVVEVSASAGKPGYIDVWLRENVVEVKQKDEDGKALPSIYEYDEYVLQVLEVNRASIEADPAPWLKLARDVEVDKLAADARAERDRLLAACDYTQTLDYACSDAERNGWAAYRQALRDITEQAGFPREIAWPDKPAREKAGDTVLDVIDAMIGGADE